MSDKKIVRIGARELTLSNIDKIYWPKTGMTKGDLIHYYHSIAEHILPYLKDRPESLHRFPDGIDGESFFQKDMPNPPSWLKTIRINSESTEKDVDYAICDDEASLIFLVNLGCIELHVWNSRISDKDRPDYMVFDLDPEDVPFNRVVETAIALKEVLDDLGIDSFCKTSGASGMHVYVPTGTKYSFDQIAKTAELIALLVNKKLPETTSLQRKKMSRQKQVYIDVWQNRHGATMASPYCVRPTPMATISAPLLWDELNEDLSPEMFTVKNILQRIGKIGDPFKGIFGMGFDLAEILDILAKKLRV